MPSLTHPIRTPTWTLTCFPLSLYTQFVPPGAFSGTTPEKKASVMLTAMMTYIATWIVIDQTVG